MNKKVVVAMSGGVDSSVAAALLQEQGYEVIGMMMRLWSEPGKSNSNRCCTPESMAIARRVAGILDIPFYAIDAQDIFRNTVVEYFLEGHANGETPNPCLACNKHIRWEFLLEQALDIGADFMATGHYVRHLRPQGKASRLFEARDERKDQSYVLSVLDQSQLKHALFPLGDFTKTEVIEMARALKFPSANSKESQDLCFLAGEDYRDFLARHSPQINLPGRIVNRQGELLGQHSGLSHFTLGQRKGIGISADRPLYVIQKNFNDNSLVVGSKDELGGQSLKSAEVNWISGQAPSRTFEGHVKIRYNAVKAKASISPRPDGRMDLRFHDQVLGITPGQAAVVYLEDEVLGSGLIQSEQDAAISVKQAMAGAVA